MNLCFATALIIVLLTFESSALAASPISKLPQQFVGRWHGFPDTTPVGPKLISNGGYTFDIHAFSETSWLMENSFSGESIIPYSAQQFWVDLTSPGQGTNTYCGILEGFEIYYNNHVGSIRAEMKLMNDSTINFLHWQLTYSEGYALDWHMKYSTADDTLHTFVQLPNNVATHLDVTMKRVSYVAPVDEKLSCDIVKNYVKRRDADKNAIGPLPPPCNLTNIPQQREQEPPKNQQTNVRRRRRVCPVTGLSSSSQGVHHHNPHDFPLLSNIALQKQQQKSVIDDRSSNRHRRPNPKTGQVDHPQYLHCVRLNNYTDFKIYWNWLVPSKTVEILFSSAIPADVFSAASDAYIAVGWNLNWPLMQGLEGVVGYFPSNSSSSSSSSSSATTAAVAGCVIPIYVNQPVGTPGPNPKQILDRTQIFTSDGGSVLNVAFARSWSTGFYDLSQMVPGPDAQNFNDVAFAIGQAGSSCSSFDFGYHFGNRGVHGFSFAKPEEAFAENLYC